MEKNLKKNIYIYVCKCVYVCVCLVAQLCPTLCDPMDYSPPGSSVPGDSPGKNTGVGCHALLQGFFLTQQSNWGLPHCRWILYQMSYPGNPKCIYIVCVCVYTYIYVCVCVCVCAHTCVSLNHFAIHLKLTQYCKLSIFQFLKKDTVLKPSHWTVPVRVPL